MDKIIALAKKHQEILSYLFFGALTTAVNYAIYIPCHSWLQFSATVSNVISWVGAVAFAYLTNKPFVFHSYDWSMKTVLPEALKFVTARIGSGVLETLILLLTVDILGWSGIVMKLITSVLVVILNYIGSKLLVFTKRKGEKRS